MLFFARENGLPVNLVYKIRRTPLVSSLKLPEERISTFSLSVLGFTKTSYCSDKLPSDSTDA